MAIMATRTALARADAVPGTMFILSSMEVSRVAILKKQRAGSEWTYSFAR